MRYVSATLYAIAIATGSGQLLNGLAIGFCIFTGTVALVFAIEGVVRDIIRKAGKTNG